LYQFSPLTGKKPREKASHGLAAFTKHGAESSPKRACVSCGNIKKRTKRIALSFSKSNKWHIAK